MVVYLVSPNIANSLLSSIFSQVLWPYDNMVKLKLNKVLFI